MAAACDAVSKPSRVYGIIGNIPPQYHSRDLRNYFSQFVETNGFRCFHFRHRPEKKQFGETSQSTTSTAQNVNIVGHGSRHKPSTNKQTTCCIVKLTESKMGDLIKMYHRKHWLDTKGNSMPALCFISKIKVSKHTGKYLSIVA